ncbi:uncharacterized protein LOC110703068 [Chenopodium quinoa]|uniref:uncharacterized protein LOC110703068 n=1 Tax=Chenopodium quinoa TaxID=63459 RepID=UPI000B76EF8B|nr:uncharacterized protein LOC110703068 [Chenopodium quinoa]
MQPMLVTAFAGGLADGISCAFSGIFGGRACQRDPPPQQVIVQQQQVVPVVYDPYGPQVYPGEVVYPGGVYPAGYPTDHKYGFVVFPADHQVVVACEGQDGTAALKLDMTKAYDRVEWCFLESVMLKFGFKIARIMQCLSSVSFSFKYNGKIKGSLTPSRGLRQGDPISPYLFLLCAEAFSTLISKAVNDKLLSGVRICRGAPRISHLFFADDSIVFAKENLQECSKIADIINTYERASGQKVNLSKTEVAFSKCVSLDQRNLIVAALGVREERIWKKLQGWKEKLLSRPGKEVMIKVVAQAIPTYMMNIFKTPDGLIDEIHSILARFWWGSNGVDRKMHWHSWEKLCLPKSMGGLGFRDLKCFNQALLAKQCWRLSQEGNPLLHAILKARYYKNSDFLEALRGFDPSYSWRSMWGAKSLLLDGLKWRVGNGVSIRVWEESWVRGEGQLYVPTPLPNHNPDLRVCELIDFNGGCWDVGVLDAHFNEGDKRAILDIPLSRRWQCDMRYWWPTKDGYTRLNQGIGFVGLGICERGNSSMGVTTLSSGNMYGT